MGPVFDCIVWNDGKMWRACVDTTEQGDLEKCKVLTNYRDSHEYGTFSYSDMLNYSVRILNEENVLQIVTDSSSHGTHVASIASGYFKETPELNGIAPGAQIVSIKIGDNRINGMETGFALVNACRHVIENKCDLVNYSFGEPMTFANQGPGLTAVQELIEKYGVIFCASAGNDGPGVETVGAPGGFCSSVVSVAAYLSNDMIKAEHSLMGSGASMLFTWSSRGPCVDGNAGVSVAAPGGAFASVPNWCQRGTQLMSGTSMASPNCCGCLALVLSGLKANHVDYNPFGVKRAIENTALDVDELVGQGAGLIQVEKAYDYLIQHKENIFQKIQFECRCYLSKSRQTRGIYLKNSDELNDTRDFMMTVEPFFFETHSRKDYLPLHEQPDNHDESLLNTQKDKISLNRKLALVCDNNDNATQWVEFPPHLYIVNSQKQFFIRIKAKELEDGRHYSTFVKAYDIDNPNMGCIFKIPINVIKPTLFDETSNKKLKNDFELEFKNVQFKQGKVYRHFIRPPFGATHAELTLKCENIVNTRDHTPLFFVQGFTLENFRTANESAREEAHRLNTTNEFKYLLKLNSNKIAQISIAKNWSNIGQITASYTIKLRGLYPRNLNEMTVFSNQPYRIDVGAWLRNEDCDPSVKYTHMIQPLRTSEPHQIELIKPSMGHIKPIYQIVLTYSFHQIKSGEVCFEAPLLSHFLYENEYQSVFWMLFEANTKRYMLSGDAFPYHYKYSRSIEKGDYVVKLYIRHEKVEMIEKIKDVTLNLRHSLASSVSQDIYTSYAGLLKGIGKKNGSDQVVKNTETSYYLAPLLDDKLPKGSSNGNYLVGELSFFKDQSINKVDHHRIFYQLTNCSNNTHAKKSTSKSQAKSSTESTETPSSSNTSLMTKNPDDDKLNEAIRDLRVAHVLKSNDIFDSLKHEYESHIPIYLNRIQYLTQSMQSDPEKKILQHDEIISLSKMAIEKINQNDLLRYYGEKNHDPATDDKKKDFDNQKYWIIELLVCQGTSLIEKNLSILSLGEELSSDEIVESFYRSSLFDEIKSVYVNIKKWTDTTDEKVSKFMLKFYSALGLHGKILKSYFKQLEEKSNLQSIDQSLLNTLQKLKLTHAQSYFANHLILKYSQHYATY